MHDHFFAIHKPLVHPIPIESEIAGIDFTFIERGLVGPDKVFFQPLAYPHGVVGRMALIRSETALVGRLQ